jgi:23S rRNA A1618 N6-methylase RlmF
MTTVRTIKNGKSASFPIIGQASAGYHVAGAEITGNVINQAEKIITIDDLLIAHSFVSEIDELRNHYDIRQIYANELGEALSRTVDNHLLQLAVLAISKTYEDIIKNINNNTSEYPIGAAEEIKMKQEESRIVTEIQEYTFLKKSLADFQTRSKKIELNQKKRTIHLNSFFFPHFLIL